MIQGVVENLEASFATSSSSFGWVGGWVLGCMQGVGWVSPCMGGQVGGWATHFNEAFHEGPFEFHDNQIP